MKNLIALLGAMAAVGNLAAHPKIAKDLEKAPANPAVKVIVQFHRPPGQSQLDNVKRQGGLPGLDLGVVNGLTYTISSAAVAALANDADVKYISPIIRRSRPDRTEHPEASAPETGCLPGGGRLSRSKHF